MKALFAAVAVAVLSVSSAAHAFCTTNPGQMGWDAAKNACEDILNGYVPDPWGRAQKDFSGELVFEPEKVCSIRQVVTCKNAMSQYARRYPACGHLIATRAEVVSPDGTVLGTADDIWRTYVFQTCNL